MKKRQLLLILAIGLSLAPAVFADGGDGVGAFNKSYTGGQSVCGSIALTQTKELPGAQAGQSQVNSKSTQADIVD